MLRGASFDPALEEEIGRAIGREVRAYGGNLFAGVCINLPIIPAGAAVRKATGKNSLPWVRWARPWCGAFRKRTSWPA
ncbi:MAG: hypothetical protein LBH70_00255 [Spirochaetaceae bacterium]|nr:hypothetical protein [Spirochaetaceae bacterium]